MHTHNTYLAEFPTEAALSDIIEKEKGIDIEGFLIKIYSINAIRSEVEKCWLINVLYTFEEQEKK